MNETGLTRFRAMFLLALLSIAAKLNRLGGYNTYDRFGRC
jgi:hypothetical protein